MKKIYTTLVAILAITQFSYAQWTTSGGNTTTIDNVGIGTTSPGYKLQVGTAGTSLNTSFNIVGNTAIAAASGNKAFYLYNDGTNLKLDAYDYGTSSPLNFQIGGNGGHVLLVPGSGNVGIGTTSPINKLDVHESSSLNTYLSISNNTISTLFGAGGTSWGLIGTSSNYDFAIYANSNEKMRVTTAGNIGIGTTSPLNKLDVAGGISLSSGGSNVLRILQNVSAAGYTGPGIYSQTNMAYGVNSGGEQIWIGINGNTEVMRLNSSGNLGIGTSTPDTKLTVNGTIHSKEVKIDLSIFPDYVFESSYRLPSLLEVKTYIDQNHHLPDMPSEQEVKENGLNLGEINTQLTKKVEELTLYLIEQNKQLTHQQHSIKSLQKQINSLKKQTN